MSNAADEFLLGGGGASAKFENSGDQISGTIKSTEVRQQTDLATGAPLTWDNGDPRQQLVVTLQTDQRTDTDDDGVRALYVKGSKKPGSQSLHDAVATAVRNSGAKSLEVGGTLTVQFIGTEPSKTRGFNDRKLYTASYTAPDKAAQAGDFLGTAPQQQVPAPQPSTQPAPAPAAAQPSPEALAAFQQWQAANQQQGA